MTKTDPSKYCKDVDSYEKGRVAAIDGLSRLMADGYLAFNPCQEVWYGLLSALYGKELGDGK